MQHPMAAFFNRSIKRYPMQGFEDLQNIKPYIDDYKSKLANSDLKLRELMVLWDQISNAKNKAATDYAVLFRKLFYEFQPMAGNSKFDQYFMRLSFMMGEAGMPQFNFENMYVIGIANAKNQYANDSTLLDQDIKNWDLLKLAWSQLEPLWKDYHSKNAEFIRIDQERIKLNGIDNEIRYSVRSFLNENASILPGVTVEKLLEDARAGIDSIFTKPEPVIIPTQSLQVQLVEEVKTEIPTPTSPENIEPPIVEQSFVPEQSFTAQQSLVPQLTIIPEEPYLKVEQAIMPEPVVPQEEISFQMPQEISEVLESVAQEFLPQASADETLRQLNQQAEEPAAEIKKLPKWIWLVPVLLFLRR